MLRSPRRAFISTFVVGVGLALTATIGLASFPARADIVAGPPAVYPSVQVTTSPSQARAFNQPQLLVDPANNNILVIAGADYNSGDCRVWVSRDAGRTWADGKGSAKPPQFATCVRSDLGPFLGAAFTADGSALVVISAADNLGGQQNINNLYAARSTDLGDTWTYTIIHAGQTDASFKTALGTTVTGGEHYSLISAAADPTNPNYVYAGGRYQIASRAKPYGLFGIVPLRAVVATSSDGGKTFGQPVDIMANVPYNQIFGGFIPKLTVGADGTVYAFMRDDPVPATATFTKKDGEGGYRYVTLSTDHGKTWSTVLLDDSVVPLIPCDGGCTLLPSGGVDPTNPKHVYAVYSNSPPTQPTHGQNVFIKESTDGGKTWGPNVQLNDDNDNVDHQFPGISFAPNGRIDVAWLDFRSTLTYNADATQKTQRYWDIYYTYSTDHGRSWSKNMRISDRSNDALAGYTANPSYGMVGPAAVTSTNNDAYFAWSDSRNGTAGAPIEDYYFGTAQFAAADTSTSTVAGWVVPLIVALEAALLGAGIAMLVALGLTRRRREAESVTPAGARDRG